MSKNRAGHRIVAAKRPRLMRRLSEVFAPGAPTLPERLRTLVVSPERELEPGMSVRRAPAVQRSRRASLFGRQQPAATADWTRAAGEEFTNLSATERCDVVFALAAHDDPASEALLERTLEDPLEAVALAAAYA